MTSNTAGAFADSATFFDRYWKRAPYLGVRPDGRATLPTAGDLLDVVDCGLLTHHYFSVLDRGTPVPASAVTRVRDVVGNKVVGMADGELVLGRYAAGATILLHEPDQWHAGIRELVRSVTAGLDGTIRATAALVPAGAEIAWAADPDVQRFLVTLTGPAFCAETAAPLEAGQVLYLRTRTLARSKPAPPVPDFWPSRFGRPHPLRSRRI